MNCGKCSACDEARFRGWLARVEADPDQAALEHLAQEILDDLATRHPFGIAAVLGGALALLEIGDGESLSTLALELEYLAEGERKARLINPLDESLVGKTCARFATAWDGGIQR